MAKQPKQAELDIIPTLDDVISLGKVKKNKPSKLENEEDPEPVFEKQIFEVNTHSTVEDSMTTIVLSLEQQAAMWSIIDTLIQQKLETVQAELSAEISQKIFDFLQDNKSPD